ncbi:hypothetical protein HK100_007155 [Physocladia obscura]|uniref:RING-type domain-containing protein n=1 Tax=Physocladia obscura TaxID=109957 RepID=A0AAD5T7B2_9FUNG|nr:hypothetical protein HK100_007155 [Physocladia obscura]
MEDPERSALRLRQTRTAANPNLDDFMATTTASASRTSTAPTHQPDSFLGLADIFGSLLRDNSAISDNSPQRQMLEGLLTQEAQSGAAGQPVASKFFLRNLPNAKVTSSELITVLLYLEIFLYSVLSYASDGILRNETKNQPAPCSICVENFDSESRDDPAKQLPCNHVFHKQCITPWLKLHNTCPFCRWEVPTDDAVYERGRKQRQKVEAKKRGIVLDDEEDDDPMGHMTESSAEKVSFSLKKRWH